MNNTEFSIVSFLNKVQLLVKSDICEINDNNGLSYVLFNISRVAYIRNVRYILSYVVIFHVARLDDIGHSYKCMYVGLNDVNFYCLNNIKHKLVYDYPFSHFTTLFDFLKYLKYNFISDCWYHYSRGLFNRNAPDAYFTVGEVSFGDIVSSYGVGEEYLKLYE